MELEPEKYNQLSADDLIVLSTGACNITKTMYSKFSYTFIFNKNE